MGLPTSLADRIRIANEKPVHERGECVVYWMQAAQRVQENPALVYAIETANKLQKRLIVCFGLTAYPHAQRVHYEFLLEGLQDVAKALAKRGIEFICKQENPVELALSFDACVIITDENYTRVPRQWRERLAKEAPVQVVIVDSNLVVPAHLREKEEWAAYTIRPKLWKDAPRFLIETKIPAYAKADKGIENTIPKLTLDLADNAKRLAHVRGGEVAAQKALQQFIDKLSDYEQRNDPSKSGTSHLSAYLHFGHISPVTIVLAVTAAAAMDKRIDVQAQAFIEQVFIRREVAHNFTYFNPKYDELASCPDWAQKTLDKHRGDKRDYVYSRKELENGKTHDELWNVAQQEMRRSGYMHNYLRMLWAKKILEWSETPEDAFKIAVYLNDVYELDGRDANGYTGIAWSIGGKHDRPWFDRPVYGAIRYMSSDSARKKFDANAYESYVQSLPKS